MVDFHKDMYMTRLKYSVLAKRNEHLFAGSRAYRVKDGELSEATVMSITATPQSVAVTLEHKGGFTETLHSTDGTFYELVAV